MVVSVFESEACENMKMKLARKQNSSLGLSHNTPASPQHHPLMPQKPLRQTHSSYPMMQVSKARHIIRQECRPIEKPLLIQPSSHQKRQNHQVYSLDTDLDALPKVSSERGESLPLSDALNRTLMHDVLSQENIPRFPSSMMDGYAMNSQDLTIFLNELDKSPPDSISVPLMQEESLPGAAASENPTQRLSLRPGTLCYITTGAVLPQNADIVIPIEMTEELQTKDEKPLIKIHKPNTLKKGKFIRETASDLKEGELVLHKGTTLTAAEIGLLAQLGVQTVRVYALPVIALLSTGDELVDYTSDSSTHKLSPSHIRDSNRIMLENCIRETLNTPNLHIIDCGIVNDDRHRTKTTIKRALQNADVVITTGGVSMGERDYVKPILEEIAHVHFGRVLMKPGKPSTFATTELHERKRYVFALPGNPVSSFVSFHLFVEPALHYMSGNTEWNHQILQTTLSHSVRVDPVRTEYHRCHVAWDAVDSRLLSRSTGLQQSSRLRSAVEANGLMIIPHDHDGDTIESGEEIKTVLIGSIGRLNTEQLREWKHGKGRNMVAGGHHHGGHHRHHHHHQEGNASHENSSKRSHDHRHQHAHSEQPQASQPKITFRVAVVTVSDRVSREEMEDRSTPIVEQFFEQFNASDRNSHSLWEIVQKVVVPDEEDFITNVLVDCCDVRGVDLVLTTGGTGFSRRDITPDVTAKVVHRRADALIHACLMDGLKTVPTAMLSRAIAGIRSHTLIINMPGSPKAVQQNLDTLMRGNLAHALRLMRGENDAHQ